MKVSVAGCFREIVAKDGFTGLYKGLPSTMCVSAPKSDLFQSIIPYVGLKMAFFDILKSSSKEKTTPAENFVMGGISGTLAVAVAYPTDLVRRKL